MIRMATYTVIPKPDQTFHVAIVGNDGARQTLLGFASQTDAQDWIARDQSQSAADYPRTTSDLSRPEF
jgi:hypothetical protein